MRFRSHHAAEVANTAAITTAECVSPNQGNCGTPVFADEIADGEESGDPNRGSRVGEQSECRKFQFRHAGDQRRKMTYARNEIAESEQPFADLLKPAVDAIQSALE